MRGKYDLVIIGGSFAARYAARMAVGWRGRVALVEPEGGEVQPFSWGAIYQAHLRSYSSESLFSQNTQPQKLGATQEPWETVNPLGRDLLHFLKYNQTATNFLLPEFDLASLSRSGIDVILGRGEFQQVAKNAQIAFIVNQRILRSRRYLLATELTFLVPAIPGLEEAGYVTTNDLGTNFAAQSWVVMGNPYPAAEISLMLRGLGKTVTLVSPKKQLFPQEEPIANTLLQGELETAGVHLLTDSPVTLIKSLEGKSWVQAGDRAIEAEQILLCPRQLPQTWALNLATAGVQIRKQGIVLNQYLQTTNPHIYACSDPPSYAVAQIQIILKNAFLLPIFPFKYYHQPQITYTRPTLARIGMTEQSAQQKHGQDVIVLREYLKDQPLAQIRNETTGFCQLIVRRNGSILGATVVGSQAPELIAIIALAMSTGLKVSDLAQLPETNGSLLQRTAAQGQPKRPYFYYLGQEIKGFLLGK